MPLDWKTDYRRYRRYFIDLSALYKNRKVVVYTGLTLTMLAIAFFSLFALKPTITTILALVSDIKEKKVIEQKLQAKINAVSVASTQISLYSDLLPLMDEAVPKDPVISEMIWYFEDSIKKNNLTIKSLSYDPIVAVGEIKKAKGNAGDQPVAINFSVMVYGPYENVTNFVTELENLRRIVIVDTVSMVAVSSEAAAASVDINLSVNGKFYFKP